MRRPIQVRLWPLAVAVTPAERPIPHGPLGPTSKRLTAIGGLVVGVVVDLVTRYTTHGSLTHSARPI